ncbi:MAG: GerMN domain-containing protein, partial [Actinobacteria bacterium]|nr:GerMN domain-containing protein [Actinomycetota bacterium]
VKGTDPEGIVRGFVRAATRGDNNYEIAREFLTPEYAAKWLAADQVFVNEGSQIYRQVGETVGELSLTGVANVDQDGTLTPLRPDQGTTQMHFEFAKVAGEWRISSAPKGIILDKSNFALIWTSRPLYFLTPDNRLVAENRWFLNGATLSTQIVSALLAGPSEADAGALRTAFPSGTTLASDSVPVNGETAHIEFSPELLTSNPKNMDLVRRQIAASLQSVPGVTNFEISVNGTVVYTAPVSAPDPSTRASDLITTVLKGGKIGSLVAGELEPLPRIGDRIAALRPDAVTLAANRMSAAVRHRVSGAPAVSWVSDSEIVTIDRRRGVGSPSLDRFGYLWSYADSEPDRILVQQPGGDPAILRIPGLEGKVPTAVRLSPGGNRLAMLVKDDQQTSRVLVVSVVRDDKSKPVGLGEVAATSMFPPGAPVDLDWVDEMRIVALSQGGKVTLGPLGQLAQDAGTVPSAVSVSGGGSSMLIRVLDIGKHLFGPQGSGWQQQSDDVQLIVRQG